jgi:hypothetical protein
MSRESFSAPVNDNEQVANDNEAERGYETYRELHTRLRKLLEATRESVSAVPAVTVHGEQVSFNPEKEPDLVVLAEAQYLLGAIEQYRDGLDDAQNVESHALTAEQHRERVAVALTISMLKGKVAALEARADAVTEAKRNPEAIELVDVLDMIDRSLDPEPFGNDNQPVRVSEQQAQ